MTDAYRPVSINKILSEHLGYQNRISRIVSRQGRARCIYFPDNN